MQINKCWELMTKVYDQNVSDIMFYITELISIEDFNQGFSYEQIRKVIF